MHDTHDRGSVFSVFVRIFMVLLHNTHIGIKLGKFISP
jgi:hypothetical protein